jgi:hypothetical protein
MTAKTPAKTAVSLDALAKQRHALLPEPTTFELKGVTFTLPPMKDLPLELQEKVGNMNDTVAVMKEVVGVDVVKAMYKAQFTFGDLELIGEQWQEYSGLEPGEAPASSPS